MGKYHTGDPGAKNEEPSRRTVALTKGIYRYMNNLTLQSMITKYLNT